MKMSEFGSELGEIGRYQVRDGRAGSSISQFEVVDAFHPAESVLLSFGHRGTAEMVASAMSEEYRAWQRGEAVKQAPEVSGFDAPYVEATRAMKYTNDLAPKSRWHLVYHYPGQSRGEHVLVVRDEEIPEIVMQVSAVLRHLHEVHTAATVTTEDRSTS